MALPENARHKAGDHQGTQDNQWHPSAGMGVALGQSRLFWQPFFHGLINCRVPAGKQVFRKLLSITRAADVRCGGLGQGRVEEMRLPNYPESYTDAGLWIAFSRGGQSKVRI